MWQQLKRPPWRTALLLFAVLGRPGALPVNYAGVAIYCEWEMDAQEWSLFRTEFERLP